jgi:cell fate regulator YaaT (PSP1 superfamily)
MKTDVIRVTFLHENREFYIPAGGVPLSKKDLIIVETPEGLDYCRVVESADKCIPIEIEDPKIRVLRKVTPTDVEWIATSRETEELAERFCKDMVDKLSLELKLVNVKLTFDGTKLIFFFTADKRIDFRGLVKELAKEFKTRIEMRQIGVRDKARRIGGIGICGRPLCCSTFLTGLEPITMRMAKDQNLTLSPSKISGACGRLLCCLAYEDETYRELKKGMPSIGSRVDTSAGEGTITDVHYLARTLAVTLDSGAAVKADPDDVIVLSEPEPVGDEEDEEPAKDDLLDL